METIVTNSSFDAVKYHNLTKTVYILSTYILIPRNLTKVTLFGVGLPDIWQKKYFSIFDVEYLKKFRKMMRNFENMIEC